MLPALRHVERKGEHRILCREVDGVEEQVDKAPLLGNIWVQAVKKVHTTSAVFSKQTVVPEGRVCVRVSRQNSFIPGYVPLHLKQGFSQPPQQ